MNFSLPESELAKLRRVSKGTSELELRISDRDSYSMNEPLFYKMLNYLIRRSKERPVIKVYTNYSHQISPIETVRITQTDSGQRTAIVKVKTSRPDAEFDHNLSVFRVRLGEALERNLDYTNPVHYDMIGKVKLDEANARMIERHEIKIEVNIKGKVEMVTFELSKVTMKGRVTYEVEVELEKGTEAVTERDIAVAALDILVQAVLSSFELPQRYFVKKVSEVEADMNLLINIAKVKKLDSFAVNPVNLKREHIPRLDQFALTNKLDGERKFLVYFSGRDHIMVMGARGWKPENPSSVYYIPLGQQQAVFPNFVLDTEFYKGLFNVFDVAIYGDMGLDAEEIHQGRMMRVNEVSRQLPYVISKQFYYTHSFQENLEQFMRDNPQPEKWFSSSDGLILTSESGSYLRTEHLKYKFYSKMSIDFRLGKVETTRGITTYELQVWDRTRNVVFNAGGRPQYLYSLIDSYDKVIAECILYRDVWFILRLRADKPVPNSIMTANSVYADIVNPITFTDLVENKSTYGDYIKVIEDLERSFFPQDLLKRDRLFRTLYEANGRVLNEAVSRLFNTERSAMAVANVMNFNISKTTPELVYELALVHSQPYGKGYFIHGNAVENDVTFPFIRNKGITSFIDAKRIFEHTDPQIYRNTFIFPKTDGLVYKKLERSEITLANFLPGEQSELKDYVKYLAAWKNGKCISRYSSLMPWHKEQVAAIMKRWIGEKDRVADLTAHVGIDAIHLRENFPQISITTYEIDPMVTRALYENTKGLNIAVYHQDSCFVMYMSAPDTFDVIYIDAPWGGESYKEEEQMELYMDQEGGPRIEVRNVKNVARHILSQRIARSVILKVPANFNMRLDDFQTEVADVTTPKGKISYRLIRLTPKLMDPVRGGQLLIWSTPYCDSPDVIFAGKQPEILVRISTNPLYDTALIKVMQWIYPYRGTHPENLLHEEDVKEPARRNQYHLIGKLSKNEVAYLHFSLTEGVPVFRAPALLPPPQQQPRPSQPSSFQQAVNRAPILQVPARRLPPPLEQKQERVAYTSMNYMRKYHNVEKNILIQFYCKNRSVLDLGAGKGGDLSKYKTAGVTRLIMVDPSTENLYTAEDSLTNRLESMPIKDITSVLSTVGQNTEEIFTEVMREGRVQVVSSFFSMTFLFESDKTLGGFLDTVDSCLIEGGYFIGTMMDGDKSHQAFMGKDSLEYDSATIIKKYSDGAEKTYRRNLWINIEDSIVKDQNEWLAFFPILEEEMKNRGFQLVMRRDFNPDAYGEAFKMNEPTKAFSRLNISFAFRKMPTQIPGAVSILPEGESQEFFNLYGEMNTLYRTGVRGDGSCFYHAYLMSTDQDYVEAETEQRKAMMRSLREDFSQWVTADKYLRLLPLATHVLLESNFRNDQVYRAAVSDAYEEKRSMTEMTNFIRDHPERMDAIMKRVKAKISNPDVWAEDNAVALFMEFRNINIYVISTTTRRPITLLKSFYKPARRESIVMLSFPDFHYESMFFGSVQQFSSGKRLFAKRVLHRMDPQLIYLHQWLVKQERNPDVAPRLEAPRQAEAPRSIVKKKKVDEEESEDRPVKKSKFSL